MQNWPNFIFLRHGQTDWNLEGRFQGQTDIPLNSTGLSQATDAARRLKHREINRVVSSPLVRALKTAAIVAEEIGLPVHVDTQIRERSFGAFDGLVVAEVKQKHGLPLSEPSASILPPDADQWQSLGVSSIRQVSLGERRRTFWAVPLMTVGPRLT